jgi:FAD/FMN-containing dehydrogenase
MLLPLLTLALAISWTQASSQLAIDAAAAGADTCATVERAYSLIELAYPSSGPYRTAQLDYWNKGCQKLSPTCILFPRNADEVAKIIDILSANDEGFAIKSGGHMPNCGFSSVERGPLIAMARMKEFKYDSDTKTVKIGPGLRWQDVAVEIQKIRRGVVGGRVGRVGVGGYLLGGVYTPQSEALLTKT